MKRLLMSFLVAGLLVTSTMSLSSCKKADTNANEEWMPTVFTTVVDDGPLSSARDGDQWYVCDYCDEPLYYCTHGYLPWPAGPLCYEHYHFHCFEAYQDCCPPGTDPVHFTCPYRFIRKHQHVTSHTTRWTYHNDHHVGGGTCP